MGKIRKVYKFGERESGCRGTFGPVQDYEKLKVLHLKNGTLFEDETFDLDERSIFYDQEDERNSDIEWLRPHQLSENPVFISDGTSRFDVVQGEMSNCWFISSVAAMAEKPKLLDQIIPSGQTFDKANYAGIFHFVFWYFGKWIDVCVSDLLPTRKKKLIFLSSKDGNEFWSALLEKAYAKLYGSYQKTEWGYFREAMEDFTGGIAETYFFGDKDLPTDLFERLHAKHKQGSIVGTETPNADEKEAKLDSGFVAGHAYTVTRIEKVTTSDGNEVQLVRIRNPWGYREWNGDWSDWSEKWDLLDEDTKKRIEFKARGDGEFWMCYEDMKKHLDCVYIIHLRPEEASDEGHFHVKYYEGYWTEGLNSGGQRDSPAYHTNPQFKFTVRPTEKHETDLIVLISLMQIGSRANTSRFNTETSYSIGFDVFKLDSESQDLSKDLLAQKEPIIESDCESYREICEVKALETGTYVVIPYTESEGDECKFLLRIYTETSADGSDDHCEESVHANEIHEKHENCPKDVDEAKKLFAKVTDGKSNEIDAIQLKATLNEHFKKQIEPDQFTLDQCRSFIAMGDEDMTGKLGSTEFVQLLSNIHDCIKAFSKLDSDQSHCIKASELKKAFFDCGFSVNCTTLKLILARYGTLEDCNGNSGCGKVLCLSAFIHCNLKLKYAIFRAEAAFNISPDIDQMDIVRSIMYS